MHFIFYNNPLIVGIFTPFVDTNRDPMFKISKPNSEFD